MNRHDAAILTLRALAIYAWFTALEAFTAGAMGVLATTLAALQAERWQLALLFLPALVYVGAGVVLFVRSRQMARYLLPAPEEPATESGRTPPLALATVTFAAVGLLIALYALPRILTEAIKIALIVDVNMRSAHLNSSRPMLVATAGQFVLGFLLFLKARAFASTWWRKQAPTS